MGLEFSGAFSLKSSVLSALCAFVFSSYLSTSCLLSKKTSTVPYCLEKYVQNVTQPSCWSTHPDGHRIEPVFGTSICVHITLPPFLVATEQSHAPPSFMAQILLSSQKLIFFPPHNNNSKFFTVNFKVLKCPWLPLQLHFPEIQFHPPRAPSHPGAPRCCCPS